MTDNDPHLAFHIDVDSGPLAVRDALADVMKALAPLSLDVEESGTVELVLAEALNNIVEHAYPSCGPAGRIAIFGDAKPDGLHFRIEDDGLPMPEGHAPTGALASIDVDKMDLPEGGFGWFLIRDLSKDVCYERCDAQNVLTFRIAVPQS